MYMHVYICIGWVAKIKGLFFLKMGKTRKKLKKEEIAEDWCFICKDGGELRICDYKDCLKAYHPPCVERDSSFLEAEGRWLCDRHFCYVCRRTAKFHCLCCPSAVCGHCLWTGEFALARGKGGFCNYCLTLALLIEDKKDVDFDGKKIDFNDKDTYEFLFKSYWDIVKVEEGLTKEHVHSAYNLLNRGKNCILGTELNEAYEGKEDFSDFEDENIISDYDESSDMDKQKQDHKRKGPKGKSCMERKVKSKKKEFVGWGSKQLFEFLASLGRDTSEVLSQYDVTSIVSEYCKRNNLFDPQKKNKVICDAKLHTLLGRKSMSRKGIYNLLNAHFAENMEESDYNFECNSKDKVENLLIVSNRHCSKSNTKFHNLRKEVVQNVQRSCFASMVVENFKLVYLRRSLVEELLTQPQTFDVKVSGSLVRVKSDPNDYLQKNSHQLLQVTGIKRTVRDGEVNADILLQVSIMPKDIPICTLSDDDFTEEECEELCQRLKNGLIRRPTVAELEKKARSLHEDITKHSIKRELTLLQKRIDRANEKGLRRDLYEYMDRQMVLKTPAEQSRLLSEVPVIIAEIEDLEPVHEDSQRKDEYEYGDSLKSAVQLAYKTSSNDLKGNDSYWPKGETGAPGGGHIRPKDFVPDIGSNSPCKANENREIGNEESPANNTKGTPQEANHQCIAGLREQKVQLHAVPAMDFSRSSKEKGLGKTYPRRRKLKPDGSFSEDLPSESCDVAPQAPVLQLDKCQSGQEIKKNYRAASPTKTLPKQSLNLSPQGQGIIQSHTVDAEEKNMKTENASTVELIELSDDGELAAEDPECSKWFCLTPLGTKIGPYPMSVLKQWNDTSRYTLKHKVWKTDQSQEEAVLLGDAIRK
ncbi:zinc finger CCCH domain-containing protein 19-like isoform X2 [Tripterygium wilfordii]|uniref:zinc finger CCCH domain-containing protein 19-like isoform X2 n=1 Tax=Tripterygium wilfordii TaxID=458696 RepID=UPI0018F82C09|nr:zinc finger CCCH domain-containing protein 19-like isoform X2 [Tripterygium wilfordii]